MAKLPSFVVIGASKCGTSSLHEYLRQHPHISLPIMKETHFFIYDRDSHNLADDSTEYPNKIDNLQNYKAEFESKAEPVTYGEVDPKYIMYPNAAYNIKKYVPMAKILCLLRNPVDRFYSSFHFLRLKRSGLSGFREVVESIKNNHMDIHTQRALDTSLYFKHLKLYYEIFPKENIKILLFDDLAKQPQKLMNSFMDFIGLEEVSFNLEKKYNPSGSARFGWLYKQLRDSPTAYFLRKHLPARFYQFSRRLGEKIMIRPYDPIPEPERKYLQNFFREDVVQLQELTRLDFSDWLA